MSKALSRRESMKLLFAGILLGFGFKGHAKGSDGGSEWASGDTSLIKVDYPGNEIFDSGNTCQVALMPSTTRGPCYYEDSTGEDISKGLSGLPMQLCLRVIDGECKPLANHIVEVWHCDHRGVYSADVRESGDASRFYGRFCSSGDRAATRSSWYRGKLTTDASGRVNFKTCFPGWYPGRTIHIHFAVIDEFQSSKVVSQLCFDDELAASICSSHEHYRKRGVQDTPLAGGSDVVFPRRGYEPFVCKTRRNADNTLLAYHTIQVR